MRCNNQRSPCVISSKTPQYLSFYFKSRVQICSLDSVTGRPCTLGSRPRLNTTAEVSWNLSLSLGALQDTLPEAVLAPTLPPHASFRCPTPPSKRPDSGWLQAANCGLCRVPIRGSNPFNPRSCCQWGRGRDRLGEIITTTRAGCPAPMMARRDNHRLKTMARRDGQKELGT